MTQTRRKFLATAAAASTAGCFAVGNDSQDEIDQREQRIESLEARLDAKNQTIQDLEVRVDAKNQTIEDLEVRVADHAAHVEELETTISAKESDLDQIESELDSVRSDRSELSAKVEELEAERDQLQTELESLNATVAKLRPQSEFSSAEIDEARDVGQQFRDRVVYIWTRNNFATGFHVGNGAHLTVSHLLDVGVYSRIWVETLGGDQFEVSLENESTDLDLRYVQGENASPALDLSNHVMPDDGDPVVMIGHPFNVGKWIISVGRYLEMRDTTSVGPDHLIVDAPVRGGNSGGPAFTLDGEFVGMATHSYWSHDAYEAPDDPFYTFAEYDPYSGIVPAKNIAGQAQAWGIG